MQLSVKIEVLKLFVFEFSFSSGEKGERKNEFKISKSSSNIADDKLP